MTQDEANKIRERHAHEIILRGFVDGRQDDCLLDAFELLHFAEVPQNIRLYIRLRNYLRAMVDMLNSVYPDHPDGWKDRYFLHIIPDSVRLCKSINVLFTIQLRKDVVFFKEGDAPLEVVSDYDTALTEINKVILPLLDRRNTPFCPDDYTINGVKQ